jgi:preprotein translocase subunit SecA
VTRAIGNAQKRVELRNFQARKRLLDYDDVMNQQREVVYSLRLFALEGGEELKGEALRMLEEAVALYARQQAPTDTELWDRAGMVADLRVRFLLSAPDITDERRIPDADALAEYLQGAMHRAFQDRMAHWRDLGQRAAAPDLDERLLAHVLLTLLDEKWKDHLYDLDQLRNAIQYRAWGQKDPLVEYKADAFEMFVDLMNDIRATFAERLFRFQVQVTGPGGAAPPPRRPPPRLAVHPSAETDLMVGGGRPASAAAPARTAEVPKVGRNDPCPCGSGRKYKKCHGANA